MSDTHDPWKALHAKRSKKSIQSKTSDPFNTRRKPELSPISAPKKPKPRRPAPSVPIPRRIERTATEPRSLVSDTSELDFSDTIGSRTRTSSKVPSKGKERFLISIDMVSDENRELVRGAAASEGRTLSQWARRVLVSSAREK